MKIYSMLDIFSENQQNDSSDSDLDINDKNQSLKNKKTQDLGLVGYSKEEIGQKKLEKFEEDTTADLFEDNKSSDEDFISNRQYYELINPDYEEVKRPQKVFAKQNNLRKRNFKEKIKQNEFKESNSEEESSLEIIETAPSNKNIDERGMQFRRKIPTTSSLYKNNPQNFQVKNEICTDKLNKSFVPQFRQIGQINKGSINIKGIKQEINKPKNSLQESIRKHSITNKQYADHYEENKGECSQEQFEESYQDDSFPENSVEISDWNYNDEPSVIANKPSISSNIRKYSQNYLKDIPKRNVIPVASNQGLNSGKHLQKSIENISSISKDNSEKDLDQEEKKRS